MSLYNIVRPDLLVSGQPEDISQVLANFQAIQTVLNGNLEDVNMKALGISNPSLAAGILASKLAGYPGNGAVFLAGDGTWKAAAATTVRKSTPLAVNNTVTETDLLNAEITVAAGSMGAGGVVKLLAEGDILQNGGTFIPYPRWKLYLGSTVLIDSGVGTGGAVAASATRYPFYAEARLTNLGAANSQWVTLNIKQANAGNPAMYGSVVAGEHYFNRDDTGAGGTEHAFANASAVDTTLAQLLKLTIILPSAATLYECKLYHGLMEVT